MVERHSSREGSSGHQIGTQLSLLLHFHIYIEWRFAPEQAMADKIYTSFSVVAGSPSDVKLHTSFDSLAVERAIAHQQRAKKTTPIWTKING